MGHQLHSFEQQSQHGNHGALAYRESPATKRRRACIVEGDH